MVRSQMFSCIALAVLAGAAVGLSGCSAAKSGGIDANRPLAPSDDWNNPYSDVPAPKPAPAAKPAESKAVATTGRGRDYRPAVGADQNVSSMAFPTGDVNTSGLWIHLVTPKEVRSNGEYEYQIHATNLNNIAIQEVKVGGTKAENWDVVKSTPDAVRSSAGYPEWKLGTIGPQETQIIRVTGKAGKTGVSTSCLRATFDTAVCASVNVVEPALTITKTLTPESMLNCEAVLMNIEVKNTGTGRADNVKVKDTLPAGLTFDGKSVIEVPVGTLAAGESRKLPPMTLKAANKGKYDNFAEVTADGGLTAKSATVTAVVKQPTLTLECKAGGQVYIGRDASYELTVKNTGDAASNNTKITAALPAGATVTKASDGGTGTGNLVFNVGSLAAGASKTVTFSIKGTNAGAIPVSASVTGDCAVAANTQCSVTVIGSPDIGTEISDDNGVVNMGDPHTFRYAVKNQGQVDLTNVKATMTLDDGIVYVSSNAAGTPKVTGQKIEFTIGTLKVGQTIKFDIVVKGVKPGESVIRSETTSDQCKMVRNDEQVNYVPN